MKGNFKLSDAIMIASEAEDPEKKFLELLHELESISPLEKELTKEEVAMLDASQEGNFEGLQGILENKYGITNDTYYSEVGDLTNMLALNVLGISKNTGLDDQKQVEILTESLRAFVTESTGYGVNINVIAAGMLKATSVLMETISVQNTINKLFDTGGHDEYVKFVSSIIDPISEIEEPVMDDHLTNEHYTAFLKYIIDNSKSVEEHMRNKVRDSIPNIDEILRVNPTGIDLTEDDLSQREAMLISKLIVETVEEIYNQQK